VGIRLTSNFRLQVSLLITLSILFCSCNSSKISPNETDTEKCLRLVADAILKDANFQFVDQNGRRFATPEEAPPDTQLRPASTYQDWRYWNGVLNLALLRLSQVLNEPKYAEFVRKNISFNFDHYQFFQKRYKGENKWAYPFGQHFVLEELDDCGAMGASVIEVYRNDPQERYKEYIDQAAHHILTKQARLEDGTLVRGFPHKWTLWADDLYMGISFLARMGKLTGDRCYFDDAVRQVFNFHKYLFNEEKGLMHHCWYADIKQPGVAYWGRANGWALLAEADLLDRLPHTYPQREELIALLQRHIIGIAQYQSATGLWHQLLDKEDSYLETSCSAIFTYIVARAVNKGYLDPRYSSIAQHGWEGVMTRVRPDGQIEGVCTGTGVGNDLVFYYQRPAPLNDVHGIGFILLAGAEVMQIQ